MTADNLRTTWSAWEPTLVDPYATLVVSTLTHARYFNTRNLAVASLSLRLHFGAATPAPYTTVAVGLPDALQVRAGTSFQGQAIAERRTDTGERKFSLCNLSVDGATQGGADGTTYLYLDRIFVQNLGQFVAGQTYDVRGQLTFEPSSL